MRIGCKNRFSFQVNGRPIRMFRTTATGGARPVKNCSRQDVYEAMADIYEYCTSNNCEIDTDNIISIPWLEEKAEHYKRAYEAEVEEKGYEAGRYYLNMYDAVNTLIDEWECENG